MDSERIEGVEDIEIDEQRQGIVRVVHNRTNPYTMIHQDVLENAALSWEARGMLAYLLGKPDNWTVRFTDLVRQSPAGPTKTRRIFNELQKAGHVKRERISTAHGHFDWTSTIYEVPVKQDSKPTICRKPIDGKPTNGKPTDITSIDLPSTENPPATRERAAKPTRPAEQAEKPIPPKKEPTPRGVPTPNGLITAQHPAIACVRAVAIRYPPKSQWIKIVGILGDKPDYDRLKRCFVAWEGKGNRSVNLDWIYDWYVNGIPQRTNGYASPPPPPPEKPKARKAIKLMDGNNQEIEAYVYVEDSR